jgi:hypothetical protein
MYNLTEPLVESELTHQQETEMWYEHYQEQQRLRDQIEQEYSSMSEDYSHSI